MNAIYLDTSALYKLVVAERESEALELFLVRLPERASSVLARVEMLRAIARQPSDSPQVRRLAAQLLRSVPLLELDEAVLVRAGALPPPGLRSLDAIHVASALSLRDCAGVVTYDRRLAEAAAYHGLTAYSPGA